MSFFRSLCFFDVAAAVGVRGGSLLYHCYLPGYLRDLHSLHGRLVGLAFPDWLDGISGGPETLHESLEWVVGEKGPCLYPLHAEDPLESLWAFRRRFDLDFQRCSIYLGPGSAGRMEALATEVGIGNLRVMDTRYCL